MRVPRRGSFTFPAGMGGLAAEVVLQVTLCGLAALLAGALQHNGTTLVDHAFTVLSSSIAVAAAILLALGGWLSRNQAAVRVAFAVAAYGVFLLVRAVSSDSAADGLLARDFAMIGTAVLCGLALRGIHGGIHVVDRVWRATALIIATALVGCAILSPVPAETLAVATRSAIDIGAGVITGLTGLVLLLSGLRARQTVLRSAGLALLVLAAQPSPAGIALGLAGIAMLLVTAVPFVARALRALWREQAEFQSRLQAAEQAMASTAVRDHEMRNLVAGLCGAVNVLTAMQAAGESPQHHQLGAAARAELERLRRILDNNQGIADQQTQTVPSPVSVGPLLTDLVALHGTPGADIDVIVTEELSALVSPDCLAHVVTNLLVNCARHAPGARIWLTAYRRADRVVIEVSDDGPGLPAGLTTELLQPGVRGPASNGSGLGLSVSAELVGRYGGEIRLVPMPVGGSGCTVVVELPAATARSLDTVPA